MAKIATCADCGVTIDHDRHRFVDDTHGASGAPSRISEQYCDDHCPRCSRKER